MIINFSKEDLKRCFEFAVKYHLDETKSNTNRTTGQYRGLGAIINDWFLGKLIELGIAKAIGSFNKSIECELDFTLHKAGEDHRSDPDIIGIKENDKSREPKLFIETKNVSETDRYVGLTQNQLNSMLENKNIDRNPEKLFIVYANIKTNDKSKDSDVFGSYLKSEINNDLLDDFADIEDLYLTIKSVIKGSELIKYGTQFNDNSYFYETEILSGPFDNNKTEKVRNSGYEMKVLNNGELPVMMMNDYPAPAEFGKFFLKGKINLYIKINEKSKRVYVDCLEDATISNKVIGNFNLVKGNMYELYFSTIGRNPKLNRNNIWIANRNLNNIIQMPAVERLQEIASTI
jgi:hypothetical protein